MASEWQPIPGETEIDLSGLRNRSITNRTELNRAEAENIRKAMAKYLLAKPPPRSAPFTYDWCLRVHEEMLGDVWKWAGTIRTENINIGVPFHQIPDQLYALIGNLKCWAEYSTPLSLQAAMFHSEGVRIHPFRDGNGRWARLLSNVWLILHDSAIADWPTGISGKTSVIRDEYIAAVRAGGDGNYDPLLGLQQRYTPVA